MTLDGFNFGNNGPNTSVVLAGVTLELVVVAVPHRRVRIDVPAALLQGVAAVPVTLVVGGQSSGTFTLPVAPPVVQVVDIYDSLSLSDAQRAVDPCLVLVRNVSNDVVVALEGRNFGASLPFAEVALTAVDGSGPAPCTMCFVAHTVARCVTTASRARNFNLVLTVAGQASATALYSYNSIVQSPSFSSVDPLFGPTDGGTLLVLQGSNFKDSGEVVLQKGETRLRCETPPYGQEGNVTGVYYARDGKTIQVGACLRRPVRRSRFLYTHTPTPTPTHTTHAHNNATRKVDVKVHRCSHLRQAPSRDF